MPLNKKQQSAVEYLDGPLLVLAGPGTGKTQLLSKKVEYILQETDTDPSMILCITYTEAGARNMKDRLRLTIGQSADKVDIMTFHSFGQKILTRYNNFSDKPHRTYSEPIDEVTQLKIVGDIQAKLPPTYILKSIKNPGSLLKLISKIKTSNLSIEDLYKIAKRNEEDVLLLNKELSPILEKLPLRSSGKGIFFRLAELVYFPLLEKLGQLKTDKPIAERTYSIIDILYEKIFSLVEAQQNTDSPSVSTINSFLKKQFIKTNSGTYKLNMDASNKRLRELAELTKEYQTYLETNDLYDFDDMIETSIQFLEKDIEFRRSIAQEYLYIMIDEYQDTNPSQTKLIELIADEQENPSIMAVGDDDQSIFEFQGAKASSLIHFQNHYNARVIVLTDNYRSTAEILAFSRKIADQLSESFVKNTAMQHSLYTSSEEKGELKKDLTSINNDKILQTEDKNQSFISRHEFPDLDTEYNWVAQQIHDLILSGEKPSDIGVIFPKHDMAIPLLPYLRKFPNIKIAYERTENILDNQQIHEIITLCRFIFELSQGKNPTHRLPEILSFDFWQIPKTDIILSIQSSYNDRRDALKILQDYKDNPLFTSLAFFFTELAVRSFNLPLELFIDILIGRAPLTYIEHNQETSFTSPFLSYYAKDIYSAKTYHLYNQLNLLRQHIIDRNTKEKLRLADLIQVIDDYEQTKTPIKEQISYEDNSDSIQLMSAHKSKGLEFKHVFLIGIGKSGWDNSRGSNGVSLPFNLDFLQEAGNTTDGKKRLFFVAITRASKTLTLTSSKLNLQGKVADRLDFLEERINQEGQLLSPLIPHSQVILHNQSLDEHEKASAVHRHWVNKLFSPSEDLKQLLLHRTKNFRISASHISSFINLSYSGPRDFYVQEILHAPKEPVSSSLIYGILVHKIFEEITKNRISIPEALALFESEANKQDLLQADLDTLLIRGKNDLPLAISSFEEVLRADGAKAEIDFSNEHLEFEGIPITGKIDHLNIDEKNQFIDIYDFKTSSVANDHSWHNKEKLYIYQFQLLFYRLLIQQSKTYKNYTIRSMNLLFTTPNRLETTDHAEGKIHHRELSEEDIAKIPFDFKDLLHAIYQQIVSLDFIEQDSPLSSFIKNDDAKLQDIKDFCLKLVENYKISIDNN